MECGGGRLSLLSEQRRCSRSVWTLSSGQLLPGLASELVRAKADLIGHPRNAAAVAPAMNVVRKKERLSRPSKELRALVPT